MPSAMRSNALISFTAWFNSTLSAERYGTRLVRGRYKIERGRGDCMRAIHFACVNQVECTLLMAAPKSTMVSSDTS
jgi:hypothetical protein